MRQIAILAAAGPMPHAAAAACATDAEVAAFVEAFLDRAPARALGADGTLTDARRTQAELAAAMEPHLGPVIGHEAGLTSAPAMERLGVSEPVRGVLHEGMMLADGAAVPAAFGAIPLFEADLVLVAGSEAIDDDAIPEEVMRRRPMPACRAIRSCR